MERKWPTWYRSGLLLSAVALIVLFLAMSGLGRLLVYSAMPFPEDALGRALHILAYNRIPCHGARQPSGYGRGEGTITVQCDEPAETRYVLVATLTCSESAGCKWFELFCWRVEKI